VCERERERERESEGLCESERERKKDCETGKNENGIYKYKLIHINTYLNIERATERERERMTIPQHRLFPQCVLPRRRHELHYLPAKV
jgi:hypothetical protein